MLARFDNDLKDTVSKAFVISMLCFPYTIVMLLLMGVGFLISIESLLHLLYAFAFWFLIGFGLVGYLCSGLFLRAFRRFTSIEHRIEIQDAARQKHQIKKPDHRTFAKVPGKRRSGRNGGQPDSRTVLSLLLWISAPGFQRVLL